MKVMPNKPFERTPGTARRLAAASLAGTAQGQRWAARQRLYRIGALSQMINYL